MAKDAIPSIPAVPRDITDPQQRAFLQAVKDALSTRAGQTKNQLDYSPTIRELRDAGVVDIYGQGSGGVVISPTSPSNNPFDDITIPDAPTGVIVNATPWNHHVQWDEPLPATDAILSHAEVWFSDTNDRDTAVLAGTARLVFSVGIEPEAHKFYWVRFISYAGIEGPWSHTQYNGVEAISGPDPGTLLNWLSGQITEGELYQTLNDRIDYIDITDGGLVSRMTTAEGDIVSHTSQISGLTTRVTDNEGDISANTTLINGVRTDLTTAEGNISANATSLSQHDTRITTNADNITVESGRIDQVNSTINDPVTGLPAAHAGVDTNAQAIATVEGDVASVESKYSVKVDANGYVAGFGLIATSNGDLTHSEFGVSVDRFWIGSPGNTDLLFVVDASKGIVAMDGASIVTATITGAEIKNAAIDTAHIGAAAITEAKIEDAAVTNVKIGNLIRSSVLDLQNGRGWSIDKSGQIQASQIKIYAHDGTILIDSGVTYTDLSVQIDNTKQLWGEISQVPDYLEYSAFAMAPAGVFGNVRFEPDSPSDGRVTVKGDKLYLYDGSSHSITPNQVVECFPSSVYVGFMFFTPRGVTTEFIGWSNGTNHTSEWFFIAELNTNQQDFSVYDGAGTVRNSSWLPLKDTPIVATLHNKSTSGGLETFNSLVGANANLPQDGATATGPGNLVLDGVFQFFSDYGTFTDDPNWSVTSGSFGSWTDGDRGKVPYSTGTSSDTIRNNTKYPVSEGVPMYFGITHFQESGVTGTVNINARWYSKQNVYQSQETMAITEMGQNAWKDETFVVVPPAYASYVEVEYTTNNIAGGNVYLDTIYCGVTPTTITPQTTRSFIKDLSVDTLQIAGQAVTHPQWGSSSSSQTATSTWKKMFEMPVTVSEVGVPVLFLWTFNDTTDTSGRSGTTEMALYRDGVEIYRQRCYQYSGYVFGMGGGLSSQYVDDSATVGGHTYALYARSYSGSSNRFDVTYTNLIALELKR